MEKEQHIIAFQELMKGRDPGFDNSKKVKLIRHLDHRPEKTIGDKVFKESLYTLYRSHPDAFMTYQNEQKTTNFKNVEYIVSFIGEEKNTARFVGVYKNCGCTKKSEEESLFDFQKVSGFEILEEKVIIDWGNNAISWHQWYDDNKKYVVRIDRGMSDGIVPVFKSYEDVILNYFQLKAIFEQNDPEWRSKFEACNCIYMILDKSNGKQYVGSTYTNGKKGGVGKGIWKRWSEYAETGHGGNKSLELLCQKDCKYHINNFQWCILETLPLNVNEFLAIERETLYKKKFGTMEPNGYNNN